MEPGAERGWTIDDTVFPKHDATMEHTNPLFHMEIGKMYTVRLTNNSMRDHPMHLH
ncbi:MAG: multicopper oxidase domain-containing protein [Candidatus Peribacteria bacterium]|nr:MAG: multicopper oxidase domain-containing protein [Candidatus Peribacteria bacterium]